MFVNKGYFTVSRSGKFWSGIWSDMTIEQSLMRPMKSIGGLTHGRGITDSTLAKWVLGTPYYIKVHEAVEEFLESKITYGEQHVELRPSRRMRDECDIEKFTLWLTQHNPFTKLSGELVSLYSGFISDDNVNCDNAYEIGKTSMQKMKGKTFSELKLKRKDMVVTQASHKSVAIRSKEVAVNPQQLFNRILCVCDSPTKLKLYLGYELASLPPSLFDDFSLRKGTKSSFLKVFTEGITEEVTIEENVSVVIDGGFLLHCVPWQKETTYGDIIKNYCSYVINKYGNEVTVVFDGYPSEATTKGEEQSRRSEKNTSCNIDFDMSTVCITKKEPFLSNKHNKTKLISMLSEELRNSGIYSVISEADADVDIVKCGIEHLTRFSKVIVVGSDTDLLVLLVALTPENKPLIFKKEIFGKNPTVIYYDVQRLISSYKSIRQLLLFAYAVTGCDTTSSFYGLGKTKAVEALKTNPQAKFQAEKFLNENSSFDELLENGEKFILSLYGLSKYTSLNEGRYFKFTSITTKSTLKSNFDIVKLPPTSEAAHQHLLRVYLQVQLWIGNKLQPTDWGWKFETTKENGVTKKILKPVPSTKPFAPDDLLYLLSCTCKTPCGDYCRCRKSGVKCSPMCENCNGLSCLNSTTLDEETDDFFEI